MSAADIIARLAERGWTLGVAESLTGGALTSALVAVPGASAVLRGGFVVYATDLKTSVLGVDAALLDRKGPVDPDVASQMAQGVRRVAGRAQHPAEVGVATTGVAGPTAVGASPVGRVYLAVSTPAGERVVREDFAGDRAQIRAAAVEAALKLLEGSL